MVESTVRAAVSLNNTGVSLMEKGRVSRALRLFKDVTILLKRPHEVPREQIREHLRRAEISIASIKGTNQASLIDIVAVDDDDDTAKQDAILYGSSSSVLFPIRLRQTWTVSNPFSINGQGSERRISSISSTSRPSSCTILDLPVDTVPSIIPNVETFFQVQNGHYDPLNQYLSSRLIKYRRICTIYIAGI